MKKTLTAAVTVLVVTATACGSPASEQVSRGQALPEPGETSPSEPVESNPEPIPNPDDIVIVQDEPNPPEDPQPYTPPPEPIAVNLDPLAGLPVVLETNPFDATGFRIGDSVYEPSGDLPEDFLPDGQPPRYEIMPDWVAVSSGDLVVGYSVNSLRFDVPSDIESFVYDENGLAIGTVGPTGFERKELKP